MRRMLEIVLKFTVATGHQHPHLQAFSGNYARLLQQMGRSPQEVLAQLNAVGQPFGYPVWRGLTTEVICP